MKQFQHVAMLLGFATLTATTVLLPGPSWAQGGAKRQGRNADRDQAPLAGRIVKGIVQGMAFGSAETATITVKTDDGETLVLPWINAKFHWNNTDSTPSTFALKNPNGSPIAILYAQAQGKASLREAWDLVSWNTELNNHKGVKTGGITQLTNRVLTTLNYRYALTKDTLWIKNGKAASREDFNSRDTVFVKGDTSTGVPVALTVADTEAGANINALELNKPGVDVKPVPQGNTRPPSRGGGRVKPDGDGLSPTEEARQGGNSRPPSVGTAYTIRMFVKITDSADNERGETPAGQLGELASRFGVEDNKVECFGELRANGMRVWEIKQENSKDFKRKEGETLTILPSEGSGMRNGSTWRVSSATLSLTGTLYDDDLATPADVLASWTLNLNLAELAGQGEKVFRGTGGKAELHVIVTR